MNSWLLVIGCVGGRSKRVHPHNFVHHRRKNCEAEPVWYKKRMAQKARHEKTNTSEAEPVLVTTIVQLNQCHFTKIVKLNQSGTKNEWLIFFCDFWIFCQKEHSIIIRDQRRKQGGSIEGRGIEMEKEGGGEEREVEDETVGAG